MTQCKPGERREREREREALLSHLLGRSFPIAAWLLEHSALLLPTLFFPGGKIHQKFYRVRISRTHMHKTYELQSSVSFYLSDTC